MAGVKINDATEFASAQNSDKVAAARGGASGSLTVQKILAQAANNGYLTEALALAAGFLIGDPEGLYVRNTGDNAKWQLGQKNMTIPIVSGTPNTITPDCEETNIFTIQPSSSELQLQVPSNIPSNIQLGGAGGVTFHWVIYARNSSPGSAGFVSFASQYTKLPGSKDYTAAGDTRLNIIHCWYQAGEYYYKIDNDTYAPEQLIPLDVTITSAQVLSSNTSMVELIDPPTGYFVDFINLKAQLVDGDTPYATNTSAVVNISTSVFIDIDLTDATKTFIGVDADVNDFATNDGAVNFLTLNGDPTAGNYDIRIWGDYKLRPVS